MRDISYFAALHEVDPTLAIKVASCESRLNPRAKNASSTAKGLFQFLDGTWKYYGLKKWGTLEGKDVLNYEDNAELATWVMSKRGLRDWLASKHCWKVALPPTKAPVKQLAEK